MNTPHEDESLRLLLKEAMPPTARANPAFRTDVWARIDAMRRAPSTWSEWLRLHRISMAVACAASMVVAVLGGGWAAARDADRERERMARLYIATIDPFPAPAAGASTPTP